MIQNICYESILNTSNNPSNVALLIKNLNKEEIHKHYISKTKIQEKIYAFNLKFINNKITATGGKDYLNKLLPILNNLHITTLLVCSSEYFKLLTGVSKVEPHHGYILPCKIKGYEHINCILSINYQALFYNPDLQSKLDLSLKTLSNHLSGSHKDIGIDIIHSEAYPDTIEDISIWLDNLHQYEALTVDIEAFSLSFNEAGIGTIAFAWDEHNGIAFAVDAFSVPYSMYHPYHLIQMKNEEIRSVLRTFFETYKGTLIYHNIAYDGKVLCYELFMNDLLDQSGLLNGISILTKQIHDTKLITYLATNSCAGNTLGLKPNTHEYTGNYAIEEINDIRIIPLDKLLKYNLIDSLATWYLFNKYHFKMIHDQQEEIYNTIFIPSVSVIMQMELSGMCLDIPRVLEVETELSKIKSKALSTINSSTIIKEVTQQLTELAWIKDFEDRKNKAKNPDKIQPKAMKKQVIFNPNSTKHLSTLLYDYLGLEITDTTNTGLPATGADVLKKKKLQLMNQFNITQEDLT